MGEVTDFSPTELQTFAGCSTNLTINHILHTARNKVTITNKELTTEIRPMWNVKAKVILVIIGATGTISISLLQYLSNIPGNHDFFCGAATQRGSWLPHSWGFFLDYNQQRTTVGRTPLDEWSARRRDLYLTTHNSHNRQTSMPPVGFEPTISAGERPQTYALDRAATGTGKSRN